jgi:hypothetical protein
MLITWAFAAIKSAFSTPFQGDAEGRGSPISSPLSLPPSPLLRIPAGAEAQSTYSVRMSIFWALEQV